jgi:low affinity Fe/Cu permease
LTFASARNCRREPKIRNLHPAGRFLRRLTFNKDRPLDRQFTRIANAIAMAAGKPLTFVLAAAIIIVWAVSGPVFHYSDTWQLVINTGTTIVTFLMVFLIQNSQNRDAAAMQAKLDEMLRAITDARESFIGIEHLTDTEIEKRRADLEKECGQDEEDEDGKAKLKGANASLDRILDRS